MRFEAEPGAGSMRTGRPSQPDHALRRRMADHQGGTETVRECAHQRRHGRPTAGADDSRIRDNKLARSAVMSFEAEPGAGSMRTGRLVTAISCPTRKHGRSSRRAATVRRVGNGRAQARARGVVHGADSHHSEAQRNRQPGLDQARSCAALRLRAVRERVHGGCTDHRISPP